jgi:hypothetical protein
LNSLVGAVDETKDGEYLAFIICDNELISRNKNAFPEGFKHIADIMYTNDTRKEIVSKLDFGGNVLACCVKFGIPEIKEHLRKGNSRNTSQKKYYQKVSYRMKSTLNTIYTPFLVKNKKTIFDIVFEVDNKTIRSFLEPAGLKCTTISELHKIVDCIAYANLKKWNSNPSNLVEKGEDFRQSFLETIKKDLSK